MPATTADQEVWLPAGVDEWSFDVLGGDDPEGMDAGGFDDRVPGTLEWEGGMPWRPDEANFPTWDFSYEDLSETRGAGDASIRREEEPKQEDEDEIQILGDGYVSELDEWDEPLSSSPELDYETSQSSNQRDRDRSRNSQQVRESESALPFGYIPSSFDAERPRLTLPPISNMVVDLTASSPSQLMTTLAPRSYNSRSPRESITDNNRALSGGGGSSSNNTATVPDPARQRPPSPKRRRTGGLTISSPSTELSPILPSMNESSDQSTRVGSSSRTHPFTTDPPQRSRPNLPPISDYLRMTSSTAEAEMIDLRDVDDTHDLAAVLAQQRQQAIVAQNPPKKPEEKDYTKSDMTHYKCPVCMDVLTNATATACGMSYDLPPFLHQSCLHVLMCLSLGHLFCHKCIIDTLKFGERRAEEEGKPPKGNCPVCRKPISRNERSGNSKQMIQLKLMTRGKKKEVESVSQDKGKGKEVDLGKATVGSEMKRKRSAVVIE
jgi:hypothetical protein